MRDIKFRAWSIEDKCYLENVSLLSYLKHGSKIMEICGAVQTDNSDGVYDCDHETVIIEQYTGRKDLNGKEIYEGDILKSKYDDSISIVKFGNYKDCYCCDGCENQYGGCETAWHTGFYTLSKIEETGKLDDTDDWAEIIGNIHENPELLEPNQ